MSKSKVVLLHGLGRTRYSMSLLARTLQKNGFETFNYGYSTRRHPISQHAAMLHEALSRFAPSHEPLSFVTHSLGSIVVRKLSSDFPSHYNFRRIVMLGPPNQGSSFAARIGRMPIIPSILGSSFHELCNLELEPCTDRLEVGIIAGGRTTERGYSPLITGDNDGIVSVEETRLEGAKDHLIVPMLHSFLMYSRQVHKEVLHFLEHGKFSKLPL